MDLRIIADANLLALRENPYPGRGLIIGLSGDGKHFIQVYWIMGRSPSSRNRIFIYDEKGSLRTEAVDPSQVKNPELIIYQAMAEDGEGWYVVSNGRQTDEIVYPFGLSDLPENWQYEPDDPNFTPRITGLLSSRHDLGFFVEILLLKRSLLGSCSRQLFRYEGLASGLGYCVTTYNGDGNPLPAFTGEPYLLPLEGDIETVAQTIWDTLNDDNKVSLAVKFIDTTTGESTLKVINKYAVR